MSKDNVIQVMSKEPFIKIYLGNGELLVNIKNVSFIEEGVIDRFFTFYHFIKIRFVCGYCYVLKFSNGEEKVCTFKRLKSLLGLNAND